MAELTAAQRNALKPSDFALPPDGYPMDTRERAADALGRVKQNGTSAEQAQVRRAVCARYSDLPECQSAGAQIDQMRNGGK
jgi:hypothetical protein